MARRVFLAGLAGCQIGEATVPAYTRDSKALETFRRMVNETLQIGISYNAFSLKRLSSLSYRGLRQYDSPSYYKLCAISRAAGILSARRKSLRRGGQTRDPYSLKPVLTAYQGFKVQDGRLRIPVGRRRFQLIRLTKRTVSVLSDQSLRLRSFTLTGSSLSVCISREVREVECTGTVGVDRNLCNLTVGNEHRTVRYDLSKSVRIAETTTEIVGSFKRDDVRVRRVVASKYGQRRRERTLQQLHNVTRQIVTRALRDRQAIVLENIQGIRRLYRRGNGKGSRYRRRMNGWSFSEAQHQIVYKAQWIGLPVVRLSRSETMGSSTVCPRCGEGLQEDRRLRRKLWCEECRALMDRDVVAALNLSRRGRLWFDRSRVHTGPEGGAVEAVKGNPTTTVIPGVDAPKSGTSVQQPKT